MPQFKSWLEASKMFGPSSPSDLVYYGVLILLESAIES
jgi:hypothetical protein